MPSRAWLQSFLLVKERVDDGRHPVPLAPFGRELPASCGRQAVEARFSIVVRDAPGTANQTALLETHQRRVERPHIETQRAFRDLLDARGKGVSVQRTQRRQRL